ncbi:MAG: ATP-binding protein [Gemmatimonadaceae bacterium]
MSNSLASSSDRPFESLETLETQPQSAEALVRAARFAITLERSAAALASPLDRSEVLETIVRTMLEALGAAAGAVTELTDDGEVLEVVCAVGYDDDLIQRFVRIPLRTFPAVEQLLHARAPVLIASQSDFEALAPTFAQSTGPAGARAALPLATSERFLGVLLLTFSDSRHFASDERDFLMALANQCAVALDRARLFEQERRARADAESASKALADSLNRMSDLYFVCSADWRYVQMNDAMRSFVRDAGFDPDVVHGQVIWDVFPRLVGGEMHRAMTRAAEAMTTVAFSARGTYADSWYEGNAFPLHDNIAVHINDTTVRRRAEKEVLRLTAALKRRVHEMETLLKVIPVGIGIANDAEATDVTANPALATWLRISPADNASKSGPRASTLPFRVLRDGAELSPEELPLQLTARTGVPVPYEEQDMLFEDGTRLTLLSSAAPIFDDQGVVRGSVGAFVDITARKRAEIAAQILSDASAAFAGSMETARTFQSLSQRVVPAMADICVIFVVRDSGSVGVEAMDANDAEMLAMFQAFDAQHPVDTTASHPVWRSLRDGASVLVPNVNDASIASMLSTELAVIELARETDTTSLLLVPIGARGKVLGAMGMGTRGIRRRFDQGDLSLAEELGRRAGMALDNARLLAAEHLARAESETARTEAERASKAKSDFLAMMSHELRTPLNAIAGYTELIELGLRGPVTEGQIADLQKIRQNQRHLLGLINSVLNFALLDAGRVSYDVTNVPVAAALRSMQPLIEPQLRARQLEYRVTACAPTVTTHADGEKLQQILLNLLGNAIKFTATGGVIEVSCDLDVRQVHLHVTDNGAGIPADQLERIFEPFVQGERSLKSTKEGVGLGLAISRELSRGMGGDLSVRSAPGEGSTFTLTLPRGPERTPLT